MQAFSFPPTLLLLSRFPLPVNSLSHLPIHVHRGYIPVMRPRFSIKRILTCFALVAAVLYLFVVRPTTVAQRLVESASSPEFNPGSLLPADDGQEWTLQVAYLLPREWADTWRCRRRAQILAISQTRTRMIVEFAAGPLHAEMRQLQLVESRF